MRSGGRAGLVAATVATALSAGAVGAAGAAPPPRPVFAADGVSASYGAHGWTLHFRGHARAALRAVAGRRVLAGCRTVPRPTHSLGGTVSFDSTGVVVRLGRHPRGPIPTLASDRDVDTCFLRTTGRARRLIAEVGVSKGGRVWVDERNAVAGLAALTIIAPDAPGYPSAAEMVRRGKGVVVALAGPDAAPPPGKLGYWTDGAQRVVLAVVSSAGHRLFYALDGEVESSNCLQYFQDDLY